MAFFPMTITSGGESPIGDGETRSNLVIAGGHETDYFKQCVFSEGDEFGWTNQNQVGGVVVNWHGFQGVGAEQPGSMPIQIDLIPFFEFMDGFWGSGAGNWLGDVMIGTAVREHTNGSVVFSAEPTFTATARGC